MPFGLSSACHLFTKLTRPLVYYWRAQGIVSFMYIDDGLIISSDITSANNYKTIVQDTITNSGFVPSKTKCIWDPTKEIQYLGIIIDSRNFQFRIPPKKMFKLLSTISAILATRQSKDCVPVKQLACFTGQIISMSLALGPISRLMTRASYRTIESINYWYQSIKLSNDTVAELEFWDNNAESLNGFSISLRLVPSMTIYTDASGVGYGGYVENQPDLQFHGNWSESETCKSSTWRELAAVYNLLSKLQILVSKLSNCILTMPTSQKLSPVAVSSPICIIIYLAISIYNLAKKCDYILIPAWLPRNENKVADKISRTQDFDDWAIDLASFNILDKLWRPHSIDRFASPHNAKLPKFNARFWCKGYPVWMLSAKPGRPPVSLIIQVIKHIIAVSATGTLVISHWPTSSFWPFICPDGIHLNSFILDWILLHISFSPPSLGPSTVFRRNPSFSCLVLRFDFSQSIRSSNIGFCLFELGNCPNCTNRSFSFQVN